MLEMVCAVSLFVSCPSIFPPSLTSQSVGCSCRCRDRGAYRRSWNQQRTVNAKRSKPRRQ